MLLEYWDDINTCYATYVLCVSSQDGMYTVCMFVFEVERKNRRAVKIEVLRVGPQENNNHLRPVTQHIQTWICTCTWGVFPRTRTIQLYVNLEWPNPNCRLQSCVAYLYQRREYRCNVYDVRVRVPAARYRYLFLFHHLRFRLVATNGSSISIHVLYLQKRQRFYNRPYSNNFVRVCIELKQPKNERR